MPIVLAITAKLIGNPEMATFSAFGCFAMMLLVDFSGPMRDRLQAQATLVLACAALITVATLASRSAVLAAAATAVVAFAVLFSGVVSSVLAGATTSLLLAFVLPVSLPGAPRRSRTGSPAGGSRAAPRCWRSRCCGPPRPTIACARGGPRRSSPCRSSPRPDRLRHPAGESRARGRPRRRDRRRRRRGDCAARLFFATPYRPTGLSTADRAVIRLVDELRWLNGVVLQSSPRRHRTDPGPVSARSSGPPPMCSMRPPPCSRPAPTATRLGDATAQLHTPLAELERSTTMHLPRSDPSMSGDALAAAVVSALDPTFRAQELSFVVAQIARTPSTSPPRSAAPGSTGCSAASLRG